MTNWGKNTWNENIDENEQIDKQKVKTNEKKVDFIKAFIKSKTETEKEKLEFIDEIMIYGRISDELHKKMQDFKDW